MLSDPAQQALEVLHDPLNHSQEVSTSYQALSQLHEIKTIVEAVYKKPGAGMGNYLISFLKMSNPLAQNIHACNSQEDYGEYISSSYDMLLRLLAYNNYDYGRNFPDFWAILLNLPEEQSRFLSLHFAQSQTGLPYSCQPMDLWIEVTMNLGSLLKAEWLNLLQNDKQLFSTIRNANNIGKIGHALESNMKNMRKQSKHVDCQSARLNKHEQAIQNILLILDEFKCFLFDSTNPRLDQFSLESKHLKKLPLISALHSLKAKL